MRARLLHTLLIPLFAVPMWSGQTADSDRVLMNLPGKSWSLSADLQGLTIDREEVQPDGRYYIFAKSDQQGLAFSAYLERTHAPADIAGCKDTTSKRAENAKATGARDIHESQSGSMEMLDYLILEYGGAPIHQKNVFACLVREDVYIDVHVSKTLYTIADEPRVSTIIHSLQTVDALPVRKVGSPAPGGVRPNLNLEDEDMRLGTKAFIARDLPGAIAHYQKVLNREKTKPFLDPITFRVLVDNLGMAYGIGGDLKQARMVFEYGVSRDVTYPLFYYNLACDYAEMEDKSKAMDYLTQAFKYRDNVIAGEAMPDPRQDDSFQRFMNDEKFRAFLDSLTKQ